MNRILQLALNLWLAAAVAQGLAAQNGAALYKRHCAGCHDPEKAGQTPDRNALAKLPAEAIQLALESGLMKSYGADLSAAERLAISDYLSGESKNQTPRAMRLDYVHTGDAAEEKFALDSVALEGPWPGPPAKTIDDTNLGKYFFEVLDAKTQRLLYSRGFASVYGEWELTAEAKARARGFSESARFPAPEGPVRVVFKKRGKHNEWREVWSVAIDPADPLMDRAGPSPAAKVWAVMKSGEPADKLDLLLLGDGYTAAEMEKWHRDAKRMAGLLFSVSPFRERRSDFNVWAIDTPAEQSGVSRPSDGIYRRSPLGAGYDAFRSERYVLTFDNKRVREVAAAAPYELMAIVVNNRKYGGGGIFNLYATTAADNAFTPYIFVHEFGHHLAGLADEYYTSDVAYESTAERPEPWEPNATADPRASKWKDLILPGVPLPTPWPKGKYEELQTNIQAKRREIRAGNRPEQEMETLFRKEREETTALLKSGPYAGKVGAFEGAMYEATGYYRPREDCIMFTRDDAGFCAVCRRAIERVINLYTQNRDRQQFHTSSSP